MKTYPTLSIITVCKNPGKDLERTIASILPQLNDEVEYIVVDGGSTDGTVEKIQQLPQGVKWISEPDSGIYEAMNKGIVLSTGQWILMVNAGDELMLDFISKFMCIIKSYEEGVIFGVSACYKNDTLIFSAVPNITITKSRILDNFCHQATIIHRILHFKFGLYSCEFKVISDRLFLYRAIINDIRLYTVPIIFTKFYFGGISSGSIIWKKEMKIYRKIAKESVFNKYRWLFLLKIVLKKVINLIGNTLKKAILIKPIEEVVYSKKLFRELKRKRQFFRLLNWLFTFEKIGALPYLEFSFPTSLIINSMRKSRYRRKREIPVTITLTSFAKRFDILEFTIDSLLMQSVSAQEILIWLSHNDLKLLPKHYGRFEKYGVKFIETEDLKSYKKLVPALLSDSTKTYVTFDDDFYYDKNTLFYLYYTHLRHPQAIVSFGNALIKIYLDEIQNYLSWKRPSELKSKTIISSRILPVGAYGTLYPPQCFYHKVTDQKLFQKICPNADDLWFWGMAVLNSTKIIGLPENLKGNHIDLQEKFRKPKEQTLWHVNETANDEQLQNLLTEFPLIKQRLLDDELLAY